MARRRRRRDDGPGVIHHVMNRGVDRSTVFFDDRDRKEFGVRLADIYELFGVETLAYCLMDNHYHLLLRSEDGTLSSAMQRLAGMYTRSVNERRGRDGPLFRGRFHSIPVTTEGYLLAAIRYIHRNALDLPGVASIDHYRWSSIRSLLGVRPAPEFLAVDFVLGQFEGDPRRLRQFCERSDWNDVLDGSSVERLDTFANFVRMACAADDLEHGSPDSVPHGLERAVIVALADDMVATMVGGLASELLSGLGASARRMATIRAAQRRAADPTVDRIVNATISRFRDDAEAA